ncbi:MAG: GyrI-like domain-containing protein [Hyphomicrobiaceae bacterium]
MKLNYVYLRPTHLVSFREIGPYEHAAPAAWRKMFDWLDSQCLRGAVKRGFGMAHDDPRVTAPEKCRYEACIDMPELLPASAWEGLLPQRLPGGAYARYRHVGDHSEISGVIRDIRNSWVSSAGVTLANKRPLVEIYLDDPKFCAPEKLRTDLCLPVAFVEEFEPA